MGALGVSKSWGNMFDSDQNRIPTNVRKQCRGEYKVCPTLADEKFIFALA
jgi:hypothetical protein